MVNHGAPLSEREREVIRWYEREAEVQCQLVIGKHGEPGIACFAAGVWFGECRECHDSMILCRVHGHTLMNSEEQVSCRHCGTKRPMKMLYAVKALPMGTF
jgi:hypothetical protein